LTSFEHLIGYLTLLEDRAENFFIEAYIMVNEQGYPIDYAHTEKIQVTPIQRHLYGDTLRHYIGIEICGTKLIEKTEKKPSIILTNDQELLELRKKLEVPLLYLKSDEHVSKRSENSVSPHPDFKDDIEKTRKIIESCKDKFKITEPFDRISKALEEIL